MPLVLNDSNKSSPCTLPTERSSTVMGQSRFQDMLRVTHYKRLQEETRVSVTPTSTSALFLSSFVLFVYVNLLFRTPSSPTLHLPAYIFFFFHSDVICLQHIPALCLLPFVWVFLVLLSPNPLSGLVFLLLFSSFTLT